MLLANTHNMIILRCMNDQRDHYVIAPMMLLPRIPIAASAVATTLPSSIGLPKRDGNTSSNFASCCCVIFSISILHPTSRNLASILRPTSDPSLLSLFSLIHHKQSQLDASLQLFLGNGAKRTQGYAVRAQLYLTNPRHVFNSDA